MNTYAYQMQLENKFNKKLINKRVSEYLLETYPTQIEHTKQYALNWINQETDNIELKARLDALKVINIDNLIVKLLTVIALDSYNLPIVSVASICAKQVDLLDTRQSIVAITELLSEMCEANLFDITRKTKRESYTIISHMKLSEEVIEDNSYATVLPPMITKPSELHSNTDSPYLTIKQDSLILGGSFNHHNNDICLDFLNTMNNNAYSLDIEFLKDIEQEFNTDDLINSTYLSDYVPNSSVSDTNYIEQCKTMYSAMYKAGNKFYFSHRVDKRGRSYAMGYHINPQGTSFKKAMLNFHHKEVINGEL